MKRNTKISHLLAGLAMAALVLNIADLVATVWGLNSNAKAAQSVYAAKDVTADILPPPLYLIEMRLALSRALDGTLSADELSKEVDRLSKEYDARATYWAQNPPYGLEAQLLGQQHEAGKRFIQSSREVVAVARSNDPAALSAAVQQAHKVYQEHRQGVDVTVDAAMKFSDKATKHAEQMIVRVTQICFALALLATVVMSALSKWIMSRILVPVHEAVKVAERIAHGDFTQPINTAHTGEMGDLLNSMNKMQNSLSDLVHQVRQSTENIQTAASEIANGNMDLSQRTEQAAANLEETAASMEELNNTVRSNADSAQLANQMATSASDTARNGGQVVQQVVTTMDDIRGSSQKINDITGVIDSIAFQTNILALNAAVEAARAGENGRGFAVVAAEVRTLAHRSAQAAKEIKALIDNSVHNVEAGAHLVSNAGSTMQAVVTAVQRVSDIVGEITNSASEQTQGITQVNSAVTQLDQVTQQNAALVEQSAAAAESLKDQARRLSQLVAKFQINVPSH
jgi:methyl-accepting chemotaxis protein I, serine sensor receptor